MYCRQANVKLEDLTQKGKVLENTLNSRMYLHLHQQKRIEKVETEMKEMFLVKVNHLLKFNFFTLTNIPGHLIKCQNKNTIACNKFITIFFL